jgi:dipeptidyl aminopeptidase/acylaminoacyl peptidase
LVFGVGGHEQQVIMDVNMIRIMASITLFIMAAGCAEESAPLTSAKSGVPSSAAPAAKPRRSLVEARRGFATKPGGQQPPRDAVPQPPPEVFRLIKYRSPVGDLSAYLTPDPGDGSKRPAIVWITGGDCNSIGDVWTPGRRENDQTAAAYRLAGIVMMLPSLRGGNDNPGRHEGFLGEVDDVLAAADYLAAQPYVDPRRIYLGGHSTGGTLAMLVAETSDRFRAVFAFGPADDVEGYGGQFIYHAPGDPNESLLRSPRYWLDSVRAPLFVIEGTGGNIDSLQAMQADSTNPMVRFVVVPGSNHFNVLAPANEAIAKKIVADTGPKAAITLSAQELKGNVAGATGVRPGGAAVGPPPF